MHWWYVVGIAATQAGVGWLMADWKMVFPPVPMFAGAVAAGFFFMGRPRLAAQAGVLAGFGGGLFAEWAFFRVRLQAGGNTFWTQLGSGEIAGLFLAELTLYAALLGFFSAFISWGTEHSSLGGPPLPEQEEEPRRRNENLVRFDPREEEPGRKS